MIEYVRGRIGAHGLGDEAADIGDGGVPSARGSLRVEQDPNAQDPRGDLLEQLEPFPRQGWLEIGEPGGITLWSRDTRNKAATYGVGHATKTTGIVRVSCSCAAVAGVELPTRASGRKATNSFATDWA